MEPGCTYSHLTIGVHGVVVIKPVPVLEIKKQTLATSRCTSLTYEKVQFFLLVLFCT